MLKFQPVYISVYLYSCLIIQCAQGGGEMTTQSNLEAVNVVHCLKILSDQTRLIIMKLLQNKEYCVCQLVDMFQMSQPAISQHLSKLKKQALYRNLKKGNGGFIL